MTPFDLRPYLGYHVRLETETSVLEGDLVGVDRHSSHLEKVNIGWCSYPDYCVRNSSIISIASRDSTMPLIISVGIYLTLEFNKLGTAPIDELQKRLTPFIHIPRIIARDHFSVDFNGYQLRRGNVILRESIAQNVDDLMEQIEEFFTPPAVCDS